MEGQDEEFGPIDVVVIGYPPGAPMTGGAVPILLDLVDRGIIRVLDAMFVRKDADGTFSGFDLAELDQEHRRRPDSVSQALPLASWTTTTPR